MGKIAVSMVLAMALGLGAADANCAGNPSLGEQKASACIGCHGPNGNSIELPAPADPWPKLAGQVPEYIAKQLLDFKAGRRANVQMSPQAQSVAETDIPDLAAFFAAQSAGPDAATQTRLLAQGEQIFFKGKGRPQVVAACAGCHGLTGAGNHDWAKVMSQPPVILAPAIGSQHARYIAKQLRAFRDGSRSNDYGSVMRDIAQRLDDGEIDAVAEFVSTLGR